MAEPTEKTIKRLFALSGNICAYPRCQLPIVESAGTIIGEICHIKARHAGGPRFDLAQSEEDRHAFNNLILLCRNHHKVIDSEPDLYTVDALAEMKLIHEDVAGRNEKQEDGFFAKTSFNYGAISRNIESNFGSEWRLLPLEKANAVFAYLQGRIAKTRQARINKGKGYSAFSTFEEFLVKHKR